LNITPSLHETIEDVICQGDTLFVLGQPYTQTTNEEIEYTGLSGCPNYIQLNLLVKDTFTSEIAQTICNGDTLDFEGIQVFEPGSYSHVVESHPGCFLETILNLTVLPVIVINDLAIIGDNGFDNGAILVEIVGGTPPFTYLWSSGQTTESLFNIKHGDYTLTVTDQQGCDQIFTFEVPFINGTQDASKENNTLNVWPTILSTKDYIEVINTHTKPVRVASVAWCTLNGETFNAFNETTIEAGSEHSIKIPESFAQGLYYLKISLTDGSSQSFKVVIR
jgi:hypothetical protein